MGVRFRELDWRPTRMGDISLRRRWDPMFKKDVYEIKLDDDFLMSSLFTAAEVELARLALREVALPPGPPEQPLDVAVGGLGLGCTAQAVLEDPRVRTLVVVEALAEVIEWHERGLVPAGAALTADTRCRLEHGDFFDLAARAEGLDPRAPHRLFHAVVVDIDHSPRHVLHPDHAAFYRTEGLRRLRRNLHPGGVFALWSNDPPDARFLAALQAVFAAARAETVTFPNPLQEREAANTVYLARTGAA
ncbi:spermidine synthase family protein [Streptomonospora nanhaiensis]|uniref:Spermidine synthase n=1 Tax=Streptomonospora nanhaiensis TaxID=1323731 RepID=A0A853BWS6_9ACTN|nr:spermidine synthase [Streptomonospora nanhaiensis]MBV2366903.1 spermidine synthase [Streptomonospora nanhaiensis]NYI99205.1 spermidine synthase [Streptomonospora nanhaiensis]